MERQFRALYSKIASPTRAFARVIGPWLVIVPGIIVLRASGISALASDFFKNGLFVWFAGALLLFAGLLIIALHQYWSSVAAVLISLFGWILALRGLVLMAAPKLYERALRLWKRYLLCGSSSVSSSRLGFISAI
jgi:hypothetical protein